MPWQFACGFQWFLAVTKHKPCKKGMQSSGVWRYTGTKTRRKKHFCSDKLDKCEHHKASCAHFCQVKPKCALWDLSTTAGGHTPPRWLCSPLRAGAPTAPVGPHSPPAPPHTTPHTGLLESQGHCAGRQLEFTHLEENGSSAFAAHSKQGVCMRVVPTQPPPNPQVARRPVQGTRPSWRELQASDHLCLTERGTSNNTLLSEAFI